MRNIVLFKKIPKENKMAYLFSVGMGAGMGVLMEIILYIIFKRDGSNLYNFFLLFDNLLPISILALLFVLSKRNPIAYNTIKTRIICILLLLFAYTIGFFLPTYFTMRFAFNSLIDGFFGFLWLFLIPFITFFFGIIWTFEYPSQSPLLPTFLYSGVFIIIATYLATKGITNLPKRIILFFILGLLICVITATPLIRMHLSA